MSAAVVPLATTPAAPSNSSLRALVRADARRFARHPLFLFGVAACLLMLMPGADSGWTIGAAPLEGTVLPAFFLGVFGFVVAHRLTTSLRRTRDLADIAPVDERRRTVSLCLACLVPTAVAAVMTTALLIAAAIWPPVGIPAGAPVSWFGDEPSVDILAALIAGGPVAALGGSLLGVAVARWAPFRGSALLAVVLLVATSMFAAEGSTTIWNALAPYQVFSVSLVVDGQVRSSWLSEGLSPRWHLAYAVFLCGLAVVAALLRDRSGRRRFVVIGVGLIAAAAGALLLAVQ
jgi:hypothetical protein